MRHPGQLLGLLCAFALAGCEVIADFGSDDDVEGRTIPPTPITMVDAAPIVVDASVRDGAVLTDQRDAAVRMNDAMVEALDAGVTP